MTNHEAMLELLQRWGELGRSGATAINETPKWLSLPTLIARWASVGRILDKIASNERSNWGSCHRIVESAARYALTKVKDVTTILAAYDKEMSPLCDPLKLSFDLHRWLSSDREEAYSDWLAWVMVELGDPSRIGRVLYGGAIPEGLLACKGPCIVDREEWVPSGRLDLVIRFGSEALIVIEVKVIGADSADTVKQAGYSEWLHARGAKWKDAILIATSAERQEGYEGFRVLLWEDLCIRLRQVMPSLKREGRLISAVLMLAFVGAVEQNLLQLPSLSGIDQDSSGTLGLRLIDRLDKAGQYLQKALYA